MNWLRDGQGWPHVLRGGLKEGIVTNTPFGTAVSAQARSEAEAALANFMDGSFSIYSGPMKDSKGNTVIGDGVTYGASDLWLEGMDWTVEGVTGS